MAKFLISVLNDEFFVENEEEHLDAVAANEQALKGALAVGAKPCSAARISSVPS